MAVSKTIRLKKAPGTEAETTQAATPPAETTAAPAATAAPTGLEPASAGPKVASTSYLAYALMGIAVTVFCLAILALQAAEWTFYKTDPSVWPVK